MPCLIFLGAQHLVLVGWNSPLHRGRWTREPPAVPILFVALLGIAANVVTNLVIQDARAAVQRNREIHQICDGHHISFVKSALSMRHEDGGCYAKGTLPSRYGYTSPRRHGRSCGRWSKDISSQKPLLCRNSQKPLLCCRPHQWSRDSYSCEHEKLSDRAVAAVIYRPDV